MVDVQSVERVGWIWPCSGSYPTCSKTLVIADSTDLASLAVLLDVLQHAVPCVVLTQTLVKRLTSSVSSQMQGAMIRMDERPSSLDRNHKSKSKRGYSMEFIAVEGVLLQVACALTTADSVPLGG